MVALLFFVIDKLSFLVLEERFVSVHDHEWTKIISPPTQEALHTAPLKPPVSHFTLSHSQTHLSPSIYA
jgi:hypothetical protein